MASSAQQASANNLSAKDTIDRSSGKSSHMQDVQMPSAWYRWWSGRTRMLEGMRLEKECFHIMGLGALLLIMVEAAAAAAAAEAAAAVGSVVMQADRAVV
jgi:hypothetical protein